MSNFYCHPGRAGGSPSRTRTSSPHSCGLAWQNLTLSFVTVVGPFPLYQKWFEYEAQALIPYISNGPLISWMYPVFGMRGATWFLGVSEWSIAALLFLVPLNLNPDFFWQDIFQHPGFRQCLCGGDGIFEMVQLSCLVPALPG
jgi:Protein of unknown function, DUF417